MGSSQGLQEGGGVDHVPQSTLRRGRGNKGGLFSLSVLTGRLFSPLSCSTGGWCRVMPEESHNRNSGVWTHSCSCWRGLERQSFLPTASGPVEAPANFGWAADVGELVGGLVAAHYKDHCFPILSWTQQEVGIAPPAGCRLAKITENSGRVCTLMLCSLFSSLHLPPICIELKRNSAAHPTLCWHSEAAHLCCLIAQQIHHHSSYSAYNIGDLRRGALPRNPPQASTFLPACCWMVHAINL